MTVASVLSRGAFRSIPLKSTFGALSKSSVLSSTKTVTPRYNAQLISSILSRHYASYPSHSVISMPALSPTMTSGNIGQWQKKEGEAISAGDVLVEIETDKAQMDFEFQEDGVLAKILVEAGEKDVAVGSPIAVLVEEGTDVSAFKDFTIDDAGGAKKPAPKQESKEEKKEKAAETPSVPTSAPEPQQPQSTGGRLETVLERGDRIFASPLAKRIAAEKGIPLEKIKGTGENGRITKADVENYKPSGAVTTGAAGPATAANVPAEAAYTDIPLSNMRKIIAQRLQESKVQNPHYYVSSTLSVSKLLKLRAALNGAAKEGAYKLSVNDFLIKAVSAALLKVPAVNSAWLESEGVIRQYADADISVAVATPTGLITPIVKGANKKGLESISAEVKALSKKARDGKLQPTEYQGGTFTISNMGMNPAVERFTAIINPPQAGILAVGTVVKTAVEGENGAVEFDEQITVTASFDHRVVDGAVGGEFMKALKEIVENPLKLLL